MSEFDALDAPAEDVAGSGAVKAEPDAHRLDADNFVSDGGLDTIATGTVDGSGAVEPVADGLNDNGIKAAATGTIVGVAIEADVPPFRMLSVAVF